uniref:Cytochrome c domain-containing protein n=1 Tax=Eiseniibacteriota bacterium TaxID=2212470 RepID=A0A832MKZ9_UNCEI
MRRIAPLLALIALALGLALWPRHLGSRTTAGNDFVHFESPHVHPIAMTPDGSRLLVVNTPDNRLSVFSLAGAAPQRVAEIPVGLEPVSVAALDDSTAWVVNELSDNVSVVNLNLGHVTHTIPVGDEPADVVFANGKAYVSVRTEDAIKVFDPLTHQPLATIASPGREPRALARNAAGTRVYVAHLLAGNRTTILPAESIPPDSMPADWDYPPDPFLPPPPRQGLIVQQVAGSWYDMYGNLWNSKIKHTMPDADVTEIDTGTESIVRSFSGAGTSIFDLAVSPADGRVFTVSTESRNSLRFEPRVVGYLVETNLAVLNPATGTTSLRKLDPHIDYETLPGTQAEADSAIGTPTGIAMNADGTRAYVTSLATDKLGVINPGGGPLSSVLARVPVVGGPTGVLVDDARGRLYVVGRFRNELQTLSAATLGQIALTAIGMDPTPDEIVHGRRIFYGGFGSAHGDQSCATCHVFGDTDGLAWDLGDPNGGVVPAPPSPPGLADFHPMKGPLVTQTLKGLSGTEPFHWRGDRANLDAFNPAFVTLMGRTAPLPDSQMAAFSDFVLALRFGPNPNQALDRSFPDAPPGQPSALRGRDLFLTEPLFRGSRACNDCHDETNHGPGTNRQMVHRDTIVEFQDLKVPQMRTMYRKVGYTNGAGAASKRGFGYSHDGSATSVRDFLSRPQFTFDPDSATAAQQRMDLEAYMLAFDTGLGPAVGRQLTFDGANNGEPALVTTFATLRARAEAGDCDLVAKGRVAGQPRGWLYVGAGQWRPDKINGPQLSTTQLLALAGPRAELTVTGVPPGSGERIGIDRDRDTYLDGDELDGGSDPGDPASHPTPVAVSPGGPGAAAAFALRAVSPNPFRGACDIAFTLPRAGRVDVRVFDLLGREVRSVARGLWREAGPSSVRWDGRDGAGRAAPAGVYFVSVQSGGERASRTVVRIP